MTHLALDPGTAHTTPPSPRWRVRLLGPGIAAVLALAIPCAGSDTLAGRFADPPGATRVRAWWHWMGGYVTREGITADLEAMAHAGLGGATVLALPYSVSAYDALPIEGNTAAIRTLSPEWYDLLAFAASEAGRLGLDMGVHNCVGYATSGGPWVPVEESMQRVVASSTTARGPGIVTLCLPVPDLTPPRDRWNPVPLDHGGFYRDIAIVALSEDRTTRLVIDLVPDAGGVATWDAPAGVWTVHRIGHTTTGKSNHPTPPEGRGFETDKMSAAATTRHYHAFMRPLLDRLDAAGRRALRRVLIDSYEAGNQTWTADMRAEFARSHGYDCAPWLPALLQDTAALAPAEQKFMADFKSTVAAMFAERYFGRMARLAHADGLALEIEPYGGPFSTATVAAIADLPMDEFWTGGTPRNKVAEAGARAGKTVIGAEAFTAWPSHPAACWGGHPAMYVPDAHNAFLHGINLLYLHSMPLQPWNDAIRPGMTMGWWGSQFSRTQTWWPESRAFFDYLARCQVMLQHGILVPEAETGVTFEAADGAGLAAVRRSGPEAEVFFVVNRDATAHAFTAVFPLAGRVPQIWSAEDGTQGSAVGWTADAGKTRVPLELPAHHAALVVFHDGGVASAGAYTPPEETAARTTLEEPWQVAFPPGLGAPAVIELPALASLSLHAEPGVRHFSGTATYTTTCHVDSAGADEMWLDLGEVRHLARVTINGRDAGLAWRPPYRLRVTGLLQLGRNTIEIRVTNTWVNRLIGDENEPEDCTWGAIVRWPDKPDGTYMGRPLARRPDWLAAPAARLSRTRVTFTTWNKYTRESALPESGLIGPVRILASPHRER